MLALVPPTSAVSPPSTVLSRSDTAPGTSGVSSSPSRLTHAAILRDLGPDDLRLLQHAIGYPCVSIFLPTAPDLLLGAEDQAHVYALVHTAKSRLNLEMSEESAAEHCAAFDALIACITGQRSGEGLAFFAGPEGRAVFRLATPVEERVVIDPTFATRDLARMLFMHPPYRVLVMGNATARLYVGSGNRLREVSAPELPIDLRVTAATRDTKGHRLEAERTAKQRQIQAAFVRRVAVAVGAQVDSVHLPLVVMAPASLAAVAKREPLLEAVHIVVGSHERALPSRLVQLARPGLDEHLIRQRERALGRLDVAVRQRRSALGVHHVWTSAKRDDIDTLIVDESFRYPAWTTLGGQTLVRAFSAEMPDVLDDAVDEIIEMVQRRDGSVIFVPPGALGSDRIAAIRLRR
jgi:Bacterial archaeo-eukaryotic release factor family 3